MTGRSTSGMRSTPILCMAMAPNKRMTALSSTANTWRRTDISGRFISQSPSRPTSSCGTSATGPADWHFFLGSCTYLGFDKNTISEKAGAIDDDAIAVAHAGTQLHPVRGSPANLHRSFDRPTTLIQVDQFSFGPQDGGLPGHEDAFMNIQHHFGMDA